MEAHMEDLKLAHKEYVKKILEDTSGNKEEMNFTVGKCDNYLREVVSQIHKVLSLYSNFKFTLYILSASS